MMDYKQVPISAAKDIADKYNKQQVIILVWDKEHKLIHITTYGKTKEDCRQAADGGKLVASKLELSIEAVK